MFSNISSTKHKAKLRLLYEVAPLAFLVEKAEGKSSNGEKSLMEVEVEDYD